MDMMPDPSAAPLPVNSDDALASLNSGNQNFAAWVAKHADQSDFEAKTGLVNPRTVSTQAPFGVIIGCSDARFPLRAALGQRANSLFEIRVAGNVLAEECLGSVDYALHHLPSVKTLVVIGHTHCGAVTATVNAFLKPATVNASGLSVGLRSIVQRILGPVAQASNAISHRSETAGQSHSEAATQQLIEAAIYIHAATTALDLSVQVQQSGRDDVSVLHGVFDLQDYLIRSPHANADESSVLQVGFSPAPRDVDALEQLAAATATTILHRSQH